MKSTTQLSQSIKGNYTIRFQKIMNLLVQHTNEWIRLRIESKDLTDKNKVIKIHVVLNSTAKANLLGYLIKYSDNIAIKKDFKTHKHRLTLFIDLKKPPP